MNLKSLVEEVLRPPGERDPLLNFLVPIILFNVKDGETDQDFGVDFDW